MTTLTLTQTEGGSEVVAITCSLVYGTDWFSNRLNQTTVETADGGMVTYDAGPTVCHGVLVLKNVSYTDGQALLHWLKAHILYAKYQFTVAAVANVDLGKGKNTALTIVNWDGGRSTSGLLEYVAPGQYNVRFPYRFKE